MLSKEQIIELINDYSEGSTENITDGLLHNSFADALIDKMYGQNHVSFKNMLIELFDSITVKTIAGADIEEYKMEVNERVQSAINKLDEIL